MTQKRRGSAKPAISTALRRPASTVERTLSAVRAWVEALLGLSLFEATLLSAATSSKRDQLAAAAAAPTLLATMLITERNTVLLLIGICVANIVLAVWQPQWMMMRG